MQDTWSSGEPYEAFMGRWSSLMSERMLTWVDPVRDRSWLDVGCGTGALSDMILRNCGPLELTAVDLSDGFVEMAQKRLGATIRCHVGDANNLKFADSSFDYVVSGLILNFIPQPETALREMKRVVTDNGTIATYIWDYAGKMEFLRYFWDGVVELDPGATEKHEAIRFSTFDENQIRTFFSEAELPEPSISKLEIETCFKNFDDYWAPFLGGQGPGPTYVQSLSDSKVSILAATVKEKLPLESDGSIHLIARVWAAKCQLRKQSSSA